MPPRPRGRTNFKKLRVALKMPGMWHSLLEICQNKRQECFVGFEKAKSRERGQGLGKLCQNALASDLLNQPASTVPQGATASSSAGTST